MRTTYQSFVRRPNAPGFLLGFAAGVFVWLLLTIGLAIQRPAGSDEFTSATVVRVIDGDTIELDSGERVRYIGLDTPELFPRPECGAKAATDQNRSLVGGKRVDLLSGPEERDAYGRLLRYVFADGVFVNAQLVREGHARTSSFSRDERFRQLFAQLGADAEKDGRGLWSTCELLKHRPYIPQGVHH